MAWCCTACYQASELDNEKHRPRLQASVCLRQELDLTLEEEFLDLLLKLIRELPLADIYQTDAHAAQAPAASRPTQAPLQVSSHPASLHITLAELYSVSAACSTSKSIICTRGLFVLV